MARAAFRKKDYPLSNECYQESLAIHRESKNQSGIAYALEGFACLALVHNQPDRAVRLLGTASTLRQEGSTPLPLPDRADYEFSVFSALAQMDKPTFEAAWAVGRAMPMEQAIAEAVGEGSVTN